MKNSKLIPLGKTALVGAVVIALASAQSGVVYAEGKGDRGFGKGRMVDALGLDDAQLALFQQVREVSRDGEAEIRELREQLRALVNSNAYTESDASVLIGEINQLQADQMLTRSTAQNLFYQSLTQEQKEVFTTMGENREKRRRIKRRFN